MNPAAGQIWKEDEKRYERYVLVTHVYPDLAVIITCDADGMPKPGSKHTNAKLIRFGKASGYKYVRELAEVAAGLSAAEPEPPTKVATKSSLMPGSYIRDDGAIMVEVEPHQHVNQDIALRQGLVARH